MTNKGSVAYFSMEIGLEETIPTYAGGLGVLAGDTIRTAADLGISFVAISLVHRKGYFHQIIDATGWQTEEPVNWSPNDYLVEMPQRVSLQIEDRTVWLRAWQYQVKGIGGNTVPVYLLDSDLDENTDADRILTHYLYGGDDYYRLCQEIILGIGGVRMLRALGYNDIERFHMNEGHSSLLVLELLAENMKQAGRESILVSDLDNIRPLCVFTTHTPVPAGHDRFPLDLANRLLNSNNILTELENELCFDSELNMTYLALESSHYINGVAKKHRETSQNMFANYKIDSITNGIHTATWASGSMQALFDRHIPGWRGDNASLRYALNIPLPEIWHASLVSKQALIKYINRMTNIGMEIDVLTLVYARRATYYKRPDLLFFNLDRIQEIALNAGPMQIIYAGKAHPHDQEAKELIQHIHRIKDILKDNIKIVYLEEYDMELAKLMTAGSDLWLNTPRPPLEASGTSGMKAAINGTPSFSILDGWWIEGCIEGITGWAIGEDHGGSVAHAGNDANDARALYDKLEQVILPTFYQQRDKYIDVMRHAIALNGSFFNTQRMLNQYIVKAYFQ